MPSKEQRKKDPVKVAAGKKGGRPVTVNGLERVTVRVSPEWHARMRKVAEQAKAEGRDVPMGKIARLAVELMLKELDARDLMTVFLEDPDQIELEIRPRRDHRTDTTPAAGRRRGRGGEAIVAG
jgi:hypothetical protein